MILDEFSLRGKVALVAGASRGLGRAMALALAEAGAEVALASRRREVLEQVAADVRGLGRAALVIALDASTVAGARSMVERTVEAFGRLDVLVNSLGQQVRKPALEITEEDWDRVVSTNLKAVFFASQAAAVPMMRQGKGKIINVASLTSVQAFPNIAPYTASKGGVAQLTKALAVEWGRHGINVNAVGPGFHRTEQTAPLFTNAEWVETTGRRIPVGRHGLPEDLRGAVVFLASEASDYITGHVLFVDGGWLAD